MTSPESGINIRGAVDLSAFAARQEAAPATGDFVVEANAANFSAVIEQSQTVPVIAELYSARSQGSMDLGAVLADLITEYAGKFLLARINADAEPDLVAAFGVQAVPTVVAIVKTQPIPLFQGSAPQEQVKQVLDDVLRVAAEHGVTGSLEGAPEQAEPEPEPLPPNIQEAYEAIEREDYDGAAAAFRAELASNPADAEAKAGLQQAELLKRLEGIDSAEALGAAQGAAPSDVETHLRAADVEMSRGELQAAFTRLIEVVKATGGEERERVRQRLVDLFLLGPESAPEVAEARRNLALALF